MAGPTLATAADGYNGGMPDVQRPAMSDYGVPVDLAGALPFEWARERLAANRNYWVVTVDPAGRPHSTPVWGLWHTDDTFWFSCAASALKARNLRANPHAVVTTHDTVEFVSVEGVAAELAPPPDVARAWAEKYDESGDPAKVAESIEFFVGHAAFRVSPRKALGMIEREEEFAEKATRWVW
ncbi:pyridoxamine 5'-phosphate oxidase family protein [Dermatobacter hominis]|uniref:pyridoxamine 5'-phosphate oxidase family protein n=1 Tax=Dermatobacter hominis TaxID=2884263 RepID=UPI001D117C30|nr:pyridoxamine 5'-phosphate oxidase family protein [Dermatobacter hominis]UDY36287.1 pyridoxamine 5'-phosphate oxidase family protein [Dermatobacter hominis]